MPKEQRGTEVGTKRRKITRRPMIALALSLGLAIVGASVCMWGQALGALLLPTCHEYNRVPLSAECQQPVLYAKWGLWSAAAGAVATVVSAAWFVLRRRAWRSG